MLDPCGPFFPGLPGCRRDRSNSSPHLPLTLLTRDADELCMAMRVFRRGCLPLLAAFLLSSVLALGKSGETPHFTYHSTAAEVRLTDRKSTRLNSSHGYISYAVFCLKKKTNST